MKNNKALTAQRVLMACMVCVIVLTDQMIKRYIESQPDGRVIFRFIPLLEIVHTVNAGAAFSVLSGQITVLLAVTTSMLLLLAAAVFVYSGISQAAKWSLTVLLGGGIGNWIDRIRFGGVTDYIRVLFIRFPVFNLADVCITMSVFVLFLLLLTNRFEQRSGE